MPGNIETSLPGALFAAALAVTALPQPLQAQAAPLLSAGAGKADIVLPADLLPFQRFAVEHDPLRARVLLLDQGGQRAAVVVLDMTSIFDDEVRDLRAMVQDMAHVAPDNVLVVASHTFSAPHMFPPRPPGGPGAPGGAGKPAGAGGPPGDDPQKAQAYRAAVNTAVRAAIASAVQGLRPATVSFGTGSSDVNINRNVPTLQGWWLGAHETGPSDKVLGLVRFEDQAHHTIAALVNFPVQSAIMNQSAVKDGQSAITADLAGAAMDRVEQQLGDGAVSLFLIGAAGDQVPTYTAQRNLYDADGTLHMTDLGAAALPLIALQGERLGDAALEASRKATPLTGTKLRVMNASVDLPGQERPRELSQIHPSTTYQYKVSASSPAPYVLLALGDVAIVGVQVELSAATGAYIRAHSPFPKTMVATMVNGAAKYLPDAQGYKQITYEAMNSSYAPGAAETMSKAILQSLAALHAQDRR